MKIQNLFIDESGTSNPKKASNSCYVLSGCLINDYTRDQLKVHADQIKFAVWHRTNIVFHSREIWRKEGEFAILKNPGTHALFHKLLFDLLKTTGYQLLAVVINHSKALQLNWNDTKVYKETSLTIVRSFILSLLATKSRGRLVVESATSEKDFYFLKAASHFLARGIPDLDVSYQDVQKALTEVAFVTKKNDDIEEQIADLLAYGIKIKFMSKSKQADLSEYDTQILKIVNQKLFAFHPNTGEKKKKYYTKIESFKILP